MVAIVGEAGIRLRPNTSGFSEQAGVEIMGPLKDVAKKGAEMFGVAWGAEKTFEYLKDSVKAYSDTTEASTKAQTVFGGSFEEVQKFAEGAATSMGQSKSQALEAAGGFGNLFRSMGLATPKSAEMSMGMTKLASDLASFNNVPVDQAIGALKSGMTGMTRPLKEFGVNINAAQIQQEALSLGLVHGKGHLDAAATAQASYALIMKQTTLTQGDFTRTSGNLADQQRILKAQLENTKDEVGSAIYPFVNLAARGITGGLMPALQFVLKPLEKVGESGKKLGEDLSELTGSAKATFQGFNVAADAPLTALGVKVGKFAIGARDDLGTFRDALKGGGLGDLATGGGFAGALARLGDGLHGFRDNATTIFAGVRVGVLHEVEGIAPAMQPAIASIKKSFAGMFSGLGGGGGAGPVAGIVKMLNGAVIAIAPMITGIVGSISKQVGAILPVIASVVQSLVPVVKQVFATIIPVVKQLLPVIEQVSGIWRTLFMTAFKALAPVIPVLVGAIAQLVTTLVGGLAPILRMVGPLISTLINVAVKEFAGLLKQLVPILPPLINMLLSVGQVLAGAVLAVLKALMPVIPPLIGAFMQIAQAVGGALTQALAALAPLFPTLINVILLLVKTALQPIIAVLPALTAILPPIIGLFATLITALLPILPVLVQIVTLVIQLAVTALMPLLPVISLVANLFVALVRAAVPIIGLTVQIISWFVKLGGAMIGEVAGAVGAVIGWFQRMVSAVSGIFGKIGGALSGAFSGVAGAVGAVFSGVVGIVRAYFNFLIGIVDGAIGLINRNVIANINIIPGVHIGNIPTIPKLHSGGEFVTSNSSGEGLALLRNRELVVTPEQRATTRALLSAVSGSPVSAATAAALGGGGGGGGVTVTNNITQQPGEDASELAARVTHGTVFNLNNGITRMVGAPAGAPA